MSRHEGKKHNHDPPKRESQWDFEPVENLPLPLFLTKAQVDEIARHRTERYKLLLKAVSRWGHWVSAAWTTWRRWAHASKEIAHKRHSRSVVRWTRSCEAASDTELEETATVTFPIDIRLRKILSKERSFKEVKVRTREEREEDFLRGNSSQIDDSDGEADIQPQVHEEEQELVPGPAQVSAGETITACVTACGRLYAWAEFEATTSVEPLQSLDGHCVTSASCGSESIIVLTERRDIYVLCPPPPPPPSPSPSAIEGNQTTCRVAVSQWKATAVPLVDPRDRNRYLDCVAVDAGPAHYAALTDKGMLLMWGEGKDGRLGLGKEARVERPTVLSFVENEFIRSVSCGFGHTAAVARSGALFTWGKGLLGQLGHGSERNEALPRRVEALSNSHCTLVSCSQVELSSHTAVATTLGEIYVFGWGAERMNGQTGTNSSLPVKLAAATFRPQWSGVACGPASVMFWNACGALWCCGIMGSPLPPWQQKLKRGAFVDPRVGYSVFYKQNEFAPRMLKLAPEQPLGPGVIFDIEEHPVLVVDNVLSLAATTTQVILVTDLRERVFERAYQPAEGFYPEAIGTRLDVNKKKMAAVATFMASRK